MTITIKFKNGLLREWKPEEYTDYIVKDNLFIVLNGSQWVGIYSMDCIEGIEIGK